MPAGIGGVGGVERARGGGMRCGFDLLPRVISDALCGQRNGCLSQAVNDKTCCRTDALPSRAHDIYLNKQIPLTCAHLDRYDRA